MKLNFWQWLAVVLLVIGLAWWIYDWSHAKPGTAPTGNQMPATQPAGSQ